MRASRCIPVDASRLDLTRHIGSCGKLHITATGGKELFGFESRDQPPSIARSDR